MDKEKRKSVRRPIRYTAWVALDGGVLHNCVMFDVSDSGARIDIDDSMKIPDNFTLLLVSNGSARRNCHVVWRNPHQVGVTFERRHIHGDQATLVPKADHNSMDPVQTVKLEADADKN